MMTTPHRDLALVDPWQRSLERSLHRRAITPAIRRSLARRRRASVALSTLMVAGPTGSLLAAAGFGLGGARVDVAQASPASRAIDKGATPAAIAYELGSRGDAVAEIQRQLGVSADGFFGPVTHAAVTGFQSRNGLEVDGIVGPATWTALFGLGQAAAAAGAREGSVAVIVRERADAGTAVNADDSSTKGGTDDGASAIGGGPSERLGEPSLDVDGDVGTPTAGDRPTADGSPTADSAPRTRPVAAPPLGDGACGPLRLSSPVKGTVTSGFGPRWGRNHDGLDIAAPTGTPIRAAECGIVSFAGVQSGYGNMVCVKHSSRFETCYAHMTRYAVSQGQRVDQGQVIGYVGCTGNCTGPHLHFETRVDGSARDPRPYLGGGSVPGAPTVKAAAKSKLTASIRKDVARARVTAKAVTAVQPRATTGLAPVGTTGAPAATAPAATTTPTPAPAPAPTATAPVTPPAPTPAAAAPAPTYDAPPPTAAPAPAYEAPVPAYEPPAATTTPPVDQAPEPTYTPPVAEAPAAPVAAPQPAPTPAPAQQQEAPAAPPAAVAAPAPAATPSTGTAADPSTATPTPEPAAPAEPEPAPAVTPAE